MEKTRLLDYLMAELNVGLSLDQEEPRSKKIFSLKGRDIFEEDFFLKISEDMEDILIWEKISNFYQDVTQRFLDVFADDRLVWLTECRHHLVISFSHYAPDEVRIIINLW